ncbi:hypothetical protein Tco_1508373 [Tanacetum coccineum]
MFPSTTAISNIKLLILKKEDMNMGYRDGHYLSTLTIRFELNSEWKLQKEFSTGNGGVMSNTSTIKRLQKFKLLRKERKSKNILCMPFPREHMRNFSWNGLCKRNLGSLQLEKGYDRYQQLLSTLEASWCEVLQLRISNLTCRLREEHTEDEETNQHSWRLALYEFDGNADEGILRFGYSLNSKAYRVYNLLTKRVEVNLHVNFLEVKPNVKGVGYRWMFDIDYITDSMNYIPTVNTGRLDPDDSPMLELEIFHKSETGIFDEHHYYGGDTSQTTEPRQNQHTSRTKGHLLRLVKNFCDLVNEKLTITSHGTKHGLDKATDEASDTEITLITRSMIVTPLTPSHLQCCDENLNMRIALFYRLLLAGIANGFISPIAGCWTKVFVL